MSRPARLMRTPFELNQSIACETSAKLATCQVIWFTVTSAGTPPPRPAAL
jgi:hypothetical protein